MLLGSSGKTQAKPWVEQAEALAHWTHERLLVRNDAILSFLPAKQQQPGRIATVESKAVTEELLVRHFNATAPKHLIGLATVGGDGTSRCLLIDFARRGEDEAPAPGLRFQACLYYAERIRLSGMTPVIEDADGEGGYRLWVFLDFPCDASAVQAYGEKLTSDYADQQLPSAPLIAPGPEAGAWIRLPGLHPTTGTRSKLWAGGGNWLEGEAAVDALLNAPVSPWANLRDNVPKPKAESPGIEPPLPQDETDDAEEADQTAVDAGELSLAEDLPDNAAAQPVQPQAPTQPDWVPTPPQHAPPRRSDPHADPADVLADVAKRTGMKPSEVERRLYAWFHEQDDVIQALVLELIPQSIRPDTAQMLLERMAKASRESAA